MLAIRVELANLFSPAIRTSLKVCHNALLALWVKAKGHGSDVNQKEFNIPLETCFPRESAAWIKALVMVTNKTTRTTTEQLLLSGH